MAKRAPVWVIYRRDPWGRTRLGRIRCHSEERVWEIIRRDSTARYNGDIEIERKEGRE